MSGGAADSRLRLLSVLKNVGGAGRPDIPITDDANRADSGDRRERRAGKLQNASDLTRQATSASG